VKLSSLEELGLGLSAKDLSQALEPFLASGPRYGPERWRSEAALRRRRIFKRYAKYLLGTWWGHGRRDTEKVREEYDSAWAIGHERYDLTRREPKFTPWLWWGERILFDAAGAARFRLPLYAAVLSKLKPNRVLEVGSGDGINLLLLAGAFPETAFTGLELTAGGLAAALKTRDATSLPATLRDYAPFALREPQGFRRVQFIQGDACAMPFADQTFDLVMTVLSVEQMERVRRKALTEISRVTGGYLLNLEPFREVNSTGLRRLNVVSRDYFRGTIDSLSGYGLKPLWATADFPQEAFLGAALVLSRKQ
jgi:SAM-dependent methyltransferase